MTSSSASVAPAAAIPFQHAELETWRSNFKGVRWTEPESGWTFYGAIDDLWRKPDGSRIVVDYQGHRQGR